MEWDILVDVFTVTSPLRMECVRVPAGEFLMGSALAKDREASKGSCPSTGSTRLSSTSASIR